MRWLARVLALIAIVAIGYVVWAWRPSLPDATAPTRAALNPELIRKGAELAAFGNCAQCHTAPKGKLYAGGRAVPTPFGVVWGPNITPDLETGIGGYSKTAFIRAMRDGVDRRGRHLYPAFPYDHMAKMTEDDTVAVWAFLLTREPIRQSNPTTQLAFPLNQRMLLAGWKALFLDRRAFAPDPNQSAAWNRGAYLVEGLAHCGACHTPRNVFGAEIKSAAYSGGQADGWNAPALNLNSPAAVPWTADRIEAYLRLGRDDLHGASAGPMNEVTQSLANVSAADVAAIAIFVAHIAGNPTPERTAAALKKAATQPPSGVQVSQAPGATVYAGACAQCHGGNGRLPINPAVNLALSSTARAPDPTNFFNVVRGGVHQPAGIAGSFMPGFAEILSEVQIRDVAAYVRESFAGQPAWSNLDAKPRRTSAGK